MTITIEVEKHLRLNKFDIAAIKNYHWRPCVTFYGAEAGERTETASSAGAVLTGPSKWGTI